MLNNNATKKTRNIFSTANKYQEHIILLTLCPSIFIFLSFIGIVFIGNPVLSKILLHTSFPHMERLLNQYPGLIVFLICAIFILSLIVSFVVSNHMVAAFGRINKELDAIIAGQQRGTITYRPHDNLTKELLDRINVLIAFYLEHNNDKKST